MSTTLHGDMSYELSYRSIELKPDFIYPLSRCPGVGSANHGNFLLQLSEDDWARICPIPRALHNRGVRP